MCGIAGIISYQERSLSAEIARMTDLMVHRGPDGEGSFVSECRRVGLGHRRLSIIDLHDSGRQPMFYADRYVLSFNGEIYNYLELRDQLITLGHEFKTASDSEVILAAYHQWGDSCTKHFNGMWAFAIFDVQERQLFCSRDRYGVKPFYYTKNEMGFAFASEIKPLLLGGKCRLHESTALDYLLSGYVEHTSETFFQGVWKLPAGHNLYYRMGDKDFRIARYYQFSDHDIESDDGARSIADWLEASVKLRLRSDVKVGTCLSGGVDSSIVAAHAAKQYSQINGQAFTAITASSIDPALDETDYAGLVARSSQLDWRVIKPGAEEFSEALEDVVRLQEEPFSSPSVYMQNFVMAEARRVGCKVMLDGQGGDELFLGYNRYYPSAALSIIKRKGLAYCLKHFGSFSNNSAMSWLRMLFYFVGMFSSGLRGIAYKWALPLWSSAWRHRFTHLRAVSKACFDVVRLQKLEVSQTNLPALLRYEDKNSMWHSVEARLPYLDYRLLESTLSLPIEEKISSGWTKYGLRKSAEGLLPEAILWRKSKLSFNAPDDVWLKPIAKEMHDEVQSSVFLERIFGGRVLKKKYTTMPATLRWRLYNFAVWERLYGVRCS